mmetsp:Transcript_15135/g.21216  ORF Transcript_15135/g.21216 Transcript_15135/m.21216 type:complete len:153 (+) Transcript_15135:12-470(+)
MDGDGLEKELLENRWMEWFAWYAGTVREQLPDIKRAEKKLAEKEDGAEKASREHPYASWRRRMWRTNPRIILRNYVAQQAIGDAETGNFSTLSRLYESLKRPFQLSVEEESLLGVSSEEGVKASDALRDPDAEFVEPAPEWARTTAGIAQLS